MGMAIPNLECDFGVLGIKSGFKIMGLKRLRVGFWL